MTETMIDLPGVIAKSDDADFLREVVPRAPAAKSTANGITLKGAKNVP